MLMQTSDYIIFHLTVLISFGPCNLLDHLSVLNSNRYKWLHLQLEQCKVVSAAQNKCCQKIAKYRVGMSL